MTDDTLIYYGQALKALGDGKVGGYLAVFTDETSPDLQGDFFTKDTDFGIQKELPAYYQHGMDAKLGKRRIGAARLKVDEFGVWAEYQLELRDEYERFLLQMAEEGKLGQSSGAVSHLVERERKGDAFWVKSWPLGEASLTPHPAEPLTSAVPLKSLFTETTVDALPPAEAPPVKHEPKREESRMENPTEKAPAVVMPTAEEIAAIVTGQVEAQIKAFVEEQAKAGATQARYNVGLNMKTGLGDTEQKALCHWIRTGDMGSVRHLEAEVGEAEWGQRSFKMMPGMAQIAIKASNATAMQEGVAAAGGNAVPTGHYQGIIARRDQMMLAARLGVRNIPGKGLTVNVPLDNEADGEWVSTAERVANDQDSPALSQAVMTLVKYTKRVPITDELINDEDSQLMAFLDDFVGRGMAKTHNSLLLTEVAASGTNFQTFASSVAIAVGEPEQVVRNDDLAAYLDDSTSVAWVMRSSVYWAIAALLSSNNRIYAAGPTNQPGMPAQLLGYPVYYSDKAAAIAVGAKTIYFGNWNFVGVRNDPEFRILRDPYSTAAQGTVQLHYFFRTKYKRLQAEAIGYGTQKGT